MIKNIVIMGASGGIGSAFVRQLSSLYPDADIHAFSRNPLNFNLENVTCYAIDYDNEDSIKDAALISSKTFMIDMVVVAIGILHEANIKPEKSLKDISTEKFYRLYYVNAILPALIAKYFAPLLNSGNKSFFAALSARVGSVSDNNLGGWYSYRASKSALNMIIKNVSIEIARKNKMAIVVGLHPGTVKSNLSKPFQTSVPDNKLFNPDFSAAKMIEVLHSLEPNQSGRCFSWNGKEIAP